MRRNGVAPTLRATVRSGDIAIFSRRNAQRIRQLQISTGIVGVVVGTRNSRILGDGDAAYKRLDKEAKRCSRSIRRAICTPPTPQITGFRKVTPRPG